MLQRRIGLGAGMLAGFLASAGAALAAPQPWQMDFQPGVTPVMQNIEDFHRFVLYIINAVSLFLLALILWIAVRYNSRSNPVPSKISHNSLLEVIWTVVPVIILVVIAIP